MRGRLLAGLILMCCSFVFVPENASAAEYSFAAELKDGFSYTFRSLVYGGANEVKDSGINTNNFLDINRYFLGIDLRLDVNLDMDLVSLGVKPRAEVQRKIWNEEGEDSYSEDELEAFINEWVVKLNVLDSLVLSYGREDLQWGPSYLLSPSNPFGDENGRNVPKRELPGSDYAKLIWFPHNAWSLGLMANTDKGRKEWVEDFEMTYAAKIDYTGYQKYASVIVSQKEEADDALVGLFGSWNVTDAMILYCEGGMKENEGYGALGGGSYTFLSGPTVAVEYYHNDPGEGTNVVDVLAVPDMRFLEPGRMLTGEDYVLLQVADRDLFGAMDLSLRWIINIDDSSNMLVGLFEYGHADSTQFFISGMSAIGDEESEFSLIFDYSVMAGIEYLF